MQASQEQIAEMMMHMQNQCKFFEASVQYNPRDDTSYAAWGSMLMHLSMINENQEVKKDFLKQSIDKLEKAIEINENSKTHEGELAYFALGNALYFAFFLEKNDATAEDYLKKAKAKFSVALTKEPDNIQYQQMSEQLGSAHEQRRAAHEHLARLEGKSDDEKQVEIRNMQMQMLESMVDTHRKQVEKDPNNAQSLQDLAKALFEYAMLNNRDKAQEQLKEGLEVIQKSIRISDESAAQWVKAVLLQAQSHAELDGAKSASLAKEATGVFDSVLRKETDSTRKQALQKEQELLQGTMKAWVEEMQKTDTPQQRAAATRAPAPAGATRAAPPGPSASPSPGPSGPSKSGDGDVTGFVVLVAGAVLIGGLVWYFSQKKK